MMVSLQNRELIWQHLMLSTHDKLSTRFIVHGQLDSFFECSCRFLDVWLMAGRDSSSCTVTSCEQHVEAVLQLKCCAVVHHV